MQSPSHHTPKPASPAPGPPPATSGTVVHEYRSAYNAVVEPDRYVACGRYFLRRWMPELGPLGTCIVLALRSLGYYNPGTGARRDGIEIELPALAALAGASVATIRREFGARKGQPGQSQNPALHLFVQKESQYSRDPTTGVILRRKNIYRVMMDDPIHPLDAGRLQAALEARGKGASPMAQNAPYAAARMAQNEPREAQIEPGRAQNEPRGAQNELRGAQNEPALIDYSYSPENIENTPPDAAPPPGAAGGGAPDPGLEAPPPPVPKERGRGRDKGAEAKRLLATADTPFAKAYRRRHGLPEPGE